MGTTNMKTSVQRAFAAAALAALAGAAYGDVIELFRLADMSDLRWSPEQPDKCTVTIGAHLIVKSSVSEVSIAVEESWDNVAWYEGQYGVVGVIGDLNLEDNIAQKTVTVNNDRWSFSYNTTAPYNRIRCWASAGQVGVNQFEATAYIAKSSDRRLTI